jgi:hypothetical protein
LRVQINSIETFITPAQIAAQPLTACLPSHALRHFPKKSGFPGAVEVVSRCIATVPV